MGDCTNLVKPTGETVNNDFLNSRIVFVWADDNIFEDFYRVIRSLDGGNTWSILGNRPPNINWWYDSNVEWGKTYCYRAAAGQFETIVQDEPTCVGEYSDTICIKYSLEPFCSLTSPYSLTASTCGNSDGKLLINNYADYSLFYLFELSDSFGNSFNEVDGLYTGLTAGYYFIKAIPTTGFLKEDCEINWIEIVASNNTIAATNVSIKDSVCGSFQKVFGRGIIDLINIVEPYDYIVWDINKNVIDSGTSETPLIIGNLIKGKYYLLIKDSVCTFLINIFIDEINTFSVPGIKEIYVSQWDENVDWNYWSTANDPDYYPSVDVLKFQSTKIKEFLNTNQWYYIPVDDANVSFDQTLNKVRQGFIYLDTLSIAIDNNNATKWKTLTEVLKNRYVVVFKDNNDSWWTFGFRHGAETKEYNFSSDNGGFKLTFSSKSESNIITALNINYIDTNILN